MATFELKLVSPERTLFDEEVQEITVPTKTGEISILAGHEPIVTQLAHGDMIIQNGKKERIVALYGGFLHVEKSGRVTVLADSAEHIEEIDVQAAEEAAKIAEEAVAKAKKAHENGEILNEDNFTLAETQAELLKSLTRLKVIRKHHSHHGIKYDN